MQVIFDIYGWDVINYEIIDQGLINATFSVKTKEGKSFILQSVNHDIFKSPEAIDHNIYLIGNYFKVHFPNDTFTHLVPNKNGATLTQWENKYYRAFEN